MIHFYNKKMIPKEFKYNPNASYNPNTKHTEKNIKLVKQTIYVNKDDHFSVTFLDLFQNYQNPTLHTNEPWNTWLHSSFDWWQCQLNFAVWCATAGCRVSYQDHLRNTSGLTKTLYTFHVYYCIARILKELKHLYRQMHHFVITKTHTTKQPTKSYAMNCLFPRNKTGDRRWTMGIKASVLGVPS